MTLQTDLEAAVARVLADSNLLRAIVNGPVAGDASLVSVEAGIVKTVARALAEIGDVTNQAIKDFGNVLATDFAAKAIEAGVGGDLRSEDNLAGLADPASARGNLELGSAAIKDVDEEGGVQSYDPYTVKANADGVLQAGFGQTYQDLGSLDAMSGDTLTITAIGTSNRKGLTVDVEGTISVAAMAAGGILLRCTNSGSHTPVLSGSTPSGGSADWDNGAAAVNYIYVESDGTHRVHTIFQPGA